jgi:hypothetical protein
MKLKIYPIFVFVGTAIYISLLFAILKFYPVTIGPYTIGLDDPREASLRDGQTLYIDGVADNGVWYCRTVRYHRFGILVWTEQVNPGK